MHFYTREVLKLGDKSNVSLNVHRSVDVARFYGSARHSNRNSSHGGSSSETMGGGLSERYFVGDEQSKHWLRRDGSSKYNS